MDSIRPYENLSNMDSGSIFGVTVEQSKWTDKLTDKRFQFIATNVDEIDISILLL
jgi:hypothetical protein